MENDKRERRGERSRKTAKPSEHQPSKAELEADMRIDATFEQAARAILKGGAPRRPETAKPETP